MSFTTRLLSTEALASVKEMSAKEEQRIGKELRTSEAMCSGPNRLIHPLEGLVSIYKCELYFLRNEEARVVRVSAARAARFR